MQMALRMVALRWRDKRWFARKGIPEDIRGADGTTGSSSSMRMTRAHLSAGRILGTLHLEGAASRSPRQLPREHEG